MLNEIDVQDSLLLQNEILEKLATYIGYFILVIEHVITLHYKLDGIHQKSSIILLMLYAIQSF